MKNITNSLPLENLLSQNNTKSPTREIYSQYIAHACMGPRTLLLGPCRNCITSYIFMISAAQENDYILYKIDNTVVLYFIFVLYNMCHLNAIFVVVLAVLFTLVPSCMP